ncbi:MAG: response regulator [Flavobacteriaceae bacterium]
MIIEHAGPVTTKATDDAAHLLIVDDDRRIRTLLRRYLSEQGYRISTAENAAEARARMQGLTFDLLILDVMMPGETGLSLAEDLRKTMDVPILMLTARSEPEHRIKGLELGADDYLPKPFEPRELLLRINNILRRRQPPAEIPVTDVRFGGFTFHVARGELKRGDEMIRLTERERDMLRLFASRANETVARMELAGDTDGSERAVDVQVNRLRRKIEADPSNPICLQTVRGIGYRLHTD